MSKEEIKKLEYENRKYLEEINRKAKEISESTTEDMNKNILAEGESIYSYNNKNLLFSVKEHHFTPKELDLFF